MRSFQICQMNEKKTYSHNCIKDGNDGNVAFRDTNGMKINSSPKSLNKEFKIVHEA